MAPKSAVPLYLGSKAGRPGTAYPDQQSPGRFPCAWGVKPGVPARLIRGRNPAGDSCAASIQRRGNGTSVNRALDFFSAPNRFPKPMRNQDTQRIHNTHYDCQFPSAQRRCSVLLVIGAPYPGSYLIVSVKNKSSTRRAFFALSTSAPWP